MSSSSLPEAAKCRAKFKLFQTILDRRDAVRPLLHLLLGLLLHIMAIMMVVPVITDVLLEALCPGEKECSQAIYFSGLQQVVAGIGTMLVTPILGDLSDEYGRKCILMIPFTASVLPMAVLAYSTQKRFVYAYMIIGTVVKMFSEGGIVCLAFAYVADTVDEEFRAVAIGVLMASLSSGFVLGILVARVFPESQIFKVAAVLIAFAAVYLKLFLPQTNSANFPAPQATEKQGAQKHLFMRSTSSIIETLVVIKEKKLLRQVAVVVFFSNLGDAGLQGSLLYYLKATFGFAKDQFAELMLIGGTVSVISQLLVMPVLVHLIGEKRVLCLGLFASFLHSLLYGFAWAPWVPYLCSSLSVLSVFVFPCIGSIVSKSAGPEDQGKVQGLLASVKSFATTIAPLIVSPMTALFLSDRAPFKCPGFSIVCAAIVMVLALAQAVFMRAVPPVISSRGSKFIQVDVEVAENLM